MAESLDSFTTQCILVQEKDTNVINDHSLQVTSDEIKSYLLIEDPEIEHTIMQDLLKNGQQSITKYQDSIISEIYKDATTGYPNQLVLLLKKYFETLWKIEYQKPYPFFIAFMEKYKKEDCPTYDYILNRAAIYGNTYLKSFPVLSIILQLLLKEISDDGLKETDTFENVWSSVTNNGLRSIARYSDYIVRTRLQEQLTIPSPLFQALREYYRERVFAMLEDSKIKDRESLYESVLDNVAEHGWSTDLKYVEDKFAPKSFKILLEKLHSFDQKQRSLDSITATVATDSTSKKEEAVDYPSFPKKPENELNGPLSESQQTLSLESMVETLNAIKGQFTARGKSIDEIELELEGLKRLKRVCDDLNPSVVYLRKENYNNINELNDAIEQQRTENEEFQRRAQSERQILETKLNNMESVVREHRRLSSAAGDLARSFQLQEDYLRRFGFSNIASVREIISRTKNEKDKYYQKFKKDNEMRNDRLLRLESIRTNYNSLLSPDVSNYIPVEVMKELQHKGLNNLQDLEQKIHEIADIIHKYQENDESFICIINFDPSSTNSAFRSIVQCEHCSSDSIKKLAAGVRETGENRIVKYVNSLEQEMRKHYDSILQTESSEHAGEHGRRFRELLDKLLSLKEFSYVFQSCEGMRRVEDWQNRFNRLYNNLNDEMEKYQEQKDMKELAKRLQIAKVFKCVDSVYLDKFPTEGFTIIDSRYTEVVDRQSVADFNAIKQSISQQDYPRVAFMLSKSCAVFISAQHSVEIKHDLKQTLVNHMRDTEEKARKLEQDERNNRNLEEAKEISRDTEKISDVLKEYAIMKLLDDAVKNSIKKFVDSIEAILCCALLKRIEMVENFLKTYRFLTAERSMEHLLNLYNELGGICQANSFTKRIEQLRERFKNVQNEIYELDFQNVSRYSETSPKKFLVELKLVQDQYPIRYKNAYENMKQRIHDIFNDVIKQSAKGYWQQRSERVKMLQNALEHLPEEWKDNFDAQISQRKESINNEERTSKDELMQCLESVNRDDDAALRIVVFFERFTQQGMDANLKILRQEVLKILTECQRKIQLSIDSATMQSVAGSVQTIIRYREMLGTHIPEVLVIYEEVLRLMLIVINTCCDIFSQIDAIKDSKTIDAALENLFVSASLYLPSRRTEKYCVPDRILTKIMQSMKIAVEYFQANCENWNDALKEMQVTKIKATMIISKRYDSVIEKMRSFLDKNPIESVQVFSNVLLKVKSYKEMCTQLEQTVKNIDSKLDVQLINDESTFFPEKRNSVFREIAKLINNLREITIELMGFLPVTCDTTSAEARLKCKIEALGGKLLDNASKKSLTSEECDQFRIYYDHLASLAVNLRFDGINIKTTFLDESEKLVLEHVELLRKKFRDAIANVEEVAMILCRMKFFAENLFMFKREIDAKINEDLKLYKTQQGLLAIEVLSINLTEKEIGSLLIKEHPIFTGETWRKRRAKMQNQDNLDYVMSNLSGDDLPADVKKVLIACYGVFRDHYETLISQHLNSFTTQRGETPNLKQLIEGAKLLLPSSSANDVSVLEDSSFAQQMPVLLAHIFAVWTLINTQHYNESRGIDASRAYLLMPHVAQVIAIFRMLGCGYIVNRKFFRMPMPITKITNGYVVNNLVQIGTGEGKSVVMAVTACVFALLGVHVMCSCYSKYLSMRDQRDFDSVFKAFGVEKRIDYGTFNELCEKFLNEQCNMREKVCDMILSNKNSVVLASGINHIGSKVLLIDEVDIFVSEKFYGEIYTPAVCVKSTEIKSLFDALWQNRELRSFFAVSRLSVYTTCASKYSNWMFLFDEAIKDMLFSLKSFQPSNYIVQNDKIAYVDGESMVDNIFHGYSTIWAYYYEHQRGQISENSLQSNVGIIVNCGTFSYAEMPHDFAYITGVTGTLETLAPSEREVLRNVYHISKSTYMPSVFGKSNRNYNSTNDVRVVDKSEYFMQILGEINDIRHSHRAILIFFESEEKLMRFYNSEELSLIKKEVQIITEKVSSHDRELYIKRATTDGKVTLLTRTFGRGTDFICENSQLLINGGVHVLQTFFSEELAEEYQIMGRGARQGDRGSYRMILLDSDLEWVLGVDWEIKIVQITGCTLYKTLHEKRIEHYESKCRMKELAIEQCKHKHRRSKIFMNAMSQNTMDIVRTFLKEENRGAYIESATSRTILLMDATGSMSKLLSAAKETVCIMFERASNILREQGISEDRFSMQFVVYRNYSSTREKILEVSPWESRGPNLRMFMNTISPEGGMGNEAIEIGLWHAVQQMETKESIAQVILIGDAPPNSKEDVAKKREKRGEHYWQTTEFRTSTYYKHELRRLKDNKIPVHTFYLAEAASSDFRKIAKETDGRCESLDISSSVGAELLTKFVTEEVLRKAAGDKGEEAVELYRQRHRICYT